MTDTNPQPANEWKNLFGVCACLGEDFGFDPFWLRVAFGVGIIFAPMAVFATYFGLGAVVLATRIFVPNKPAAPTQVPDPVAANSDDLQPLFKQAA